MEMGEPSLLEVFQAEAKEIIENVEADLVNLEENISTETLNTLFRYFHTLKGSSGIAGLTEVSDFTHHIESILDKVRTGDLKVSPELIDLILGSVDWVKASIFGSENGYNIESNKSALLGKIARFKNSEPQLEIKEPVAEEVKKTIMPAESDNILFYYRVKVSFRPDIFEFGIDPLIIMEDLFSSGEVVEKQVYKNNVPLLDKIDPEKCYLSWMIILKTQDSIQKLEQIFLFVRDDNDISIDDISANYSEKLEVSDETKKIGDILVQKGVITEDELSDVISAQAEGNKKIGELILEKGYASEKDLDKALGIQDEIKKKVETTTVRVDTSKLDNLLNLLGEIVIAQSSISRLADMIKDDDISYSMKNSLYSLERTTREFQEQLMSIRMIPVGPTFTQFSRFIRDTARQIGKDIKLEINGKETELDKTVIEKIGDPLKHMIRNSIDHGIESKEDRIKAGKDERGTVKLNAYHQEGSVYIEVSDDGKGLDVDKIRNKALERGLISKDSELTDEKIISLIFQPGFSTAEKVNDLSGRGVGMDVVKTNIESLRGSVDVRSTPGLGTTFIVKLPLTLAIIEGMLIRVGKNVYIIPLLSIVESLQPKRDEIKTVKGKGEVIFVRGEYISMVRLYEYFEVDADYKNPWEALVIIVETSGEKLALLIDDLIGQQQIVIKSLDNYITRSRAVSGAAILGDGNVALILDVHGLVGDITKARR